MTFYVAYFSLPFLFNFTIIDDGERFCPVLDVFLVLSPPAFFASMCPGIFSERIVSESYVITQRLYIHRSLKNVAVVEVDLARSATADVSEPMELLLELKHRWAASYDLTFEAHDSSREQVRSDDQTFSAYNIIQID